MAKQNCGYTLHNQLRELETPAASTFEGSSDDVLQLAWANMDWHCDCVAVVAAGAEVAGVEVLVKTPIPPKLQALAPCDWNCV